MSAPTTSAIAPPSIVRLAWNAALPKGCSKLVLMCLAYHACKNERDECFPHVATIARLCNMHPRTASQHLKVLALAGLIAVAPRFNSSSVYRLNRGRLSALSSERTADAADSAQNPTTVDPAIPAPLDPAIPTLDPVLPASRPGDSCTHKGEEGGLKEEGRGSAHATAAELVEAALPPLPILEDLKTEQPEPVAAIEPVELVLDSATLAALDAARANFGMDPLTPSDCEMLADSAAAVGVTPQTVAGWQLGELRAADPLIDAATLAAVNAQRATNGKREPVKLAELVQQARLAGITPTAAAQWVLAKSGRNFFRADWYRPEAAGSTPAAQTGPVELTETGKRAQAQIARALAPSAVPAVSIVVASPSARPISAAVTLRHRAPVSVGATTGTGWASTAVERFTAGQPVSRATITSAASALGMSLADLKAQRAATLQTEGAAA